MEDANRDLEIKLTQLQITRDKTESVLASRNGNRIKTHRDVLFAVVSAVDRSKRKVEELKIASGEELAVITTWSDKLDQDTAAVDIYMEKISTFLSAIEQEQVERVRKDQLAFEKELFEKKLEYAKGLGSVHSQDQDTIHTGIQISKQSSASAKLSKLTITKFNGTSIDWMRFWGQFTLA